MKIKLLHLMKEKQPRITEFEGTMKEFKELMNQGYIIRQDKIENDR